MARCRLRAGNKSAALLGYTGRDANVGVTAARAPLADIWRGLSVRAPAQDSTSNKLN
jgi:hypothetical protein